MAGVGALYPEILNKAHGLQALGENHGSAKPVNSQPPIHSLGAEIHECFLKNCEAKAQLLRYWL